VQKKLLCFSFGLWNPHGANTHPMDGPKVNTDFFILKFLFACMHRSL